MKSERQRDGTQKAVRDQTSTLYLVPAPRPGPIDSRCAVKILQVPWMPLRVIQKAERL